MRVFHRNPKRNCTLTRRMLHHDPFDLSLSLLWFFQAETLIARNEKVTKLLAHPLIIPLKWIVLKLYTVVFMGYCLVPFVLLTYDKYWPVYKSIYFSGYLLFIGWHLYAPLVRRALKPERTSSTTNVHQDWTLLFPSVPCQKSIDGNLWLMFYHQERNRVGIGSIFTESKLTAVRLCFNYRSRKSIYFVSLDFMWCRMYILLITSEVPGYSAHSINSSWSK